jgi:hypothetical protein
MPLWYLQRWQARMQLCINTGRVYRLAVPEYQGWQLPNASKEELYILANETSRQLLAALGHCRVLPPTWIGGWCGLGDRMRQCLSALSPPNIV